MASRKPAAPAKTERPGPKKDEELSDAVLEWVSAGNSHGCPACPHSSYTGFGSGSHILVDGTVFENGTLVGKIKI